MYLKYFLSALKNSSVPNILEKNIAGTWLQASLTSVFPLPLNTIFGMLNQCHIERIPL